MIATVQVVVTRPRGSSSGETDDGEVVIDLAEAFDDVPERAR